jgi:soluble lytic murein transglycosylase
MKHSNLHFFNYELADVPVAYWHLLFPQPYWTDIVANAEKNQLDPYLVASLIRQESEFNPGALSRANAYGLMQLLPSVGKSAAKHEGNRHFTATQLLDPPTNIELGTDNLKQVLDRFGGQPEYALAAYNAGDTPVHQWLATNDYKDIPEFVESIPFTETRDYVQAILRNREMYRQLYPTH